MENMNQQIMERAGQVVQSGQGLVSASTSNMSSLAMIRPRNLKDVMRRCQDEAELGGSTFYYRWKVKNKDGTVSVVQGPSINCMMAAARNFGNLVLEPQPIQELDDAYVFTYTAIDLETNVAIGRQFKLSKDFPVYGKMDEHRKEDIRHQAAQSKAARNVLAKIIPSFIYDPMVERAMGSARTSIENQIKKHNGDIQAVAKRALASLQNFGVDQERVEKSLCVPVSAWTIETLVMLHGDLQALRNGEATVANLFPVDDRERGTVDMKGGLSTDDAKPGDTSTHTPVDKPLPKQNNSASGKQAEPGDSEEQQGEAATSTQKTESHAASPADNKKKPSKEMLAERERFEVLTGKHAFKGELKELAINTLANLESVRLSELKDINSKLEQGLEE